MPTLSPERTIIVNGAIQKPEFDQAKYDRAHNALFDHMYEISDDPSGSDPTDYLSQADVEELRSSLATAKASPDWKNASLLDMQKIWVPGFEDAWKGPLTTAKVGLTKFLWFRKKGEPHWGIIFGHLSIEPSQAVAVRDDGLLVSKRGTELQKSKGVGWGRLPDPEKMMPVLAPGKMHGVNYSNVYSAPLRTVMKNRLHGEHAR